MQRRFRLNSNRWCRCCRCSTCRPSHRTWRKCHLLRRSCTRCPRHTARCRHQPGNRPRHDCHNGCSCCCGTRAPRSRSLRSTPAWRFRSRSSDRPCIRRLPLRKPRFRPRRRCSNNRQAKRRRCLGSSCLRGCHRSRRCRHCRWFAAPYTCPRRGSFRNRAGRARRRFRRSRHCTFRRRCWCNWCPRTDRCPRRSTRRRCNRWPGSTRDQARRTRVKCRRRSQGRHRVQASRRHLSCRRLRPCRPCPLRWHPDPEYSRRCPATRRRWPRRHGSIHRNLASPGRPSRTSTARLSESQCPWKSQCHCAPVPQRCQPSCRAARNGSGSTGARFSALLRTERTGPSAIARARAV